MSIDAATATRRADLRLPTAVGAPDRRAVEVAATVVADPGFAGPRTVCFAFPGGGYGRGYFDVHHDELDGPSQAEFHAARGVVFIACDPFGGGDSTELDADARGLDATADAWDHAARHALAELERGTLVEWLGPVEVRRVIGIGHSLGGMQLLAHQARRRTFGAIAVLGWSAVHTTLPTREGELAPAAHGETAATTDLEDAWAGPMADEIAHLRYAYHWDDVPEALVAEDMSVGFPTRTAEVLPSWTTRSFPPFAAVCLTPGVVAEEAAAVTVPVFVALGERDVARAVQGEAAAYPGTRDLTLVSVPRCAHMHNFSPRRELLWARLQDWFDTDSFVGRDGPA
jgi:hypothetical protein